MNIALPSPEFLHGLAKVAEQKTLQSYLNNQTIDISTKVKEGFRFDPVTNIDRDTEKLLRQAISQQYPEHSIMGEEFGRTQGDSLFEWVIDPIDGTRPFLCGLPVWGCLIGLLYDSKAVMGIMSQPYTGDRFWSDGQASWFAGRLGTVQIKTRQSVPLNQAILHTTSPESVDIYPKNNFGLLKKQVLMTRYGGECYAMAMLAAGHIDICVEYSLQPYDIAALIPIIEHAGGVVTTIEGHRPEQGGAIIASANAQLHQDVLQILNTEE
ncbi:inositol monophosphatase family protein [Commensalibacter papalotli (ex Servin-Garciduenas et al. 2014)]|uniref:Inositol monophosphatase family protein n=1 Tax=Commensalibacter papalotli (ex Servin-Garciduenas et al. 2014) TaxID=1208583 RepID=W7E873_9PROT|nr:inositol monophosphatase family protein [Commensalibacter papalotli (ex Servin-Garciduenas et al. 2014)]EUK19341.1 Inositol monophosphatase family protein [Commensalibacter papalotli (ex Servin-Garciduenas et al. 2014)]